MQLVSECCWASLAVDQGRRHRRDKWIQEASLSRFSQSLPGEDVCTFRWRNALFVHEDLHPAFSRHAPR